MSECPNCGMPASDFALTHWRCGSNCRDQASRDEFYASAACELIRSLREELATTKTQLDTAMAITFNDARDAERDRIAQYVLHLCYIDLAKAIRNNEHRSDT